MRANICKSWSFSLAIGPLKSNCISSLRPAHFTRDCHYVRRRYYGFKILTNLSAWFVLCSLIKNFSMHILPKCTLEYCPRVIMPQLPGCVRDSDSSTGSWIEFGMAIFLSTQTHRERTRRSLHHKWIYLLAFLVSLENAIPDLFEHSIFARQHNKKCISEELGEVVIENFLFRKFHFWRCRTFIWGASSVTTELGVHWNLARPAADADEVCGLVIDALMLELFSEWKSGSFALIFASNWLFQNLRQKAIWNCLFAEQLRHAWNVCDLPC